MEIAPTLTSKSQAPALNVIMGVIDILKFGKNGNAANFFLSRERKLYHAE